MAYKRVNGLIVDSVDVIPIRKTHETQYCLGEHERRLTEMIQNLGDRDTAIVIRAIQQKYKKETSSIPV